MAKKQPIDTCSHSPKSGPRIRKIPEGDDRERLICPECDFILYDNPKIVVGTVCSYEDQVLLCKRAIEPRPGFWTMPAGYMELGETTQDGARREAYEEAGVNVDIGSLLAIYNLPHINQVQIFYRGQLDTDTLDPGLESAEARFYEWDEIPWDDLAFPTVTMALTFYKKTITQERFIPDQQVIESDLPSAV